MSNLELIGAAFVILGGFWFIFISGFAITCLMERGLEVVPKALAVGLFLGGVYVIIATRLLG